MNNRFTSKIISVSAALILFAAGCAGPEEADTKSASSEKSFTAFYFSSAMNAGLAENASGAIDNTARTIQVYVPFGQDRSSLVASFSFKGFSVTVNDDNQETGITHNDFTSDVTYKITAEDRSAADYTVTVQNQSLTPAAPIASAVIIEGSPSEGAVLTGRYSFTDPNLDSESASDRKWYRCTASGLTDMTTGCTQVASDTGTADTASTYTVVSSDIGNYIYFEVTPKTTVDPPAGTPVLSAATKQVSNVNFSFEVVDVSDSPANWTASASTLYSTDEGGSTEGSRSAWLAAITVTPTYTNIVSSKYAISHNDKVSVSVDYKTDIADQCRTIIKIDAYNSSDVSVGSESQSSQNLDSTYLDWKTKTYSPIPKFYNAAYIIITLRVNYITAGNTAKFYIDNIRVTTTPDVPAAPVASALVITGNTFEGQLLTGTYNYTDANNDVESGSIRKWYRCIYSGLSVTQMTGDFCEYITGDTGTNAVPPTYTLVNADVDKYIYFTVIPKNAVDPIEGSEVVSPAGAQITPEAPATAPVASVVTIAESSVNAGGLLTGTYSYTDANADAESGSTRKWYRCDSSGLTDMSGCTQVFTDSDTAAIPSVYSPNTSDVGKYIYFEVTPKNAVTPTTGTAVLSAASSIITTASALYGLTINEWGDAGTDIDYIEIKNYSTSLINITSSNFIVNYGATQSTSLTLSDYLNNNEGDPLNKISTLSGVNIAAGEIFIIVESDVTTANITTLRSYNSFTGKIFISTSAIIMNDTTKRLSGNYAYLSDNSANKWSFTPPSSIFTLKVGSSTFSYMKSAYIWDTNSTADYLFWGNGTAATTARSTGVNNP